jgi:signal peptidase I
MSQTLNPLRLFARGFDWSGRTARLPFLLVVLFGGGLAFLFVDGDLIRQAGRPFEIATILALALNFVPLNGHIIRRLNDADWSGWLWWLLLLPYVNIALILALLVKGSASLRFGDAPSILRGFGFVVICAAALILATRVVWTPYVIVSGSMKPALLVGDVVMVGALGPLSRGDVVAFRHPATGEDYIKRVIGLAGDTVQMQGGVAVINGTPAVVTNDGLFAEVMEPQGIQGSLPRCSNGAVGTGARCDKILQTEILPGGMAHQILNIGTQSSDDTPSVTVPGGSVFLMGDNRDNSVDSRVAVAAGGIGLVPVANLVGRVDRVLFSAAGHYIWAVWSWRPDRFWRQVR